MGSSSDSRLALYPCQRTPSAREVPGLDRIINFVAVVIGGEGVDVDGDEGVDMRQSRKLDQDVFGLGPPIQDDDLICDLVQVGRVGVWRGDVRLSMSVSAPFVWRCLSGSTIAPFPRPAHRTGHAGFPHPALGQDLTPSCACDAIGSF